LTKNACTPDKPLKTFLEMDCFLVGRYYLEI
jgi:hypothetical protein